MRDWWCEAISRQQSSATNAGRQLSAWRCASARVVPWIPGRKPYVGRSPRAGGSVMRCELESWQWPVSTPSPI
jgi:hypothetical protein